MKAEVNIRGISVKKVYDFMLNCTDNDYQRWWPGTHLAFHTLKRYSDNIGNLVYFDEYVGGRRLRIKAVVTEAVSCKRLVWQMKKIIKLPGWLSLEIEDIEGVVRIEHKLIIGYDGIGRIFDPILRMNFPTNFQKELETHAQIEFKKLAELLS